jgi:adenosine deaminase/adenosine deaminase CECR1
MKTFGIISAALICLPILAFAVPDSEIAGSDNSSFDIILDQSTIDTLSRESEVSNFFLEIRDNPEELRAFFLSMPKGGDIHNHLTGAVYAEDLIDTASSERLCFYSNNYTVTKCTLSQNTIPMSQAFLNERLYNNLVDAWSMKNSQLLNVSGHDQFFSTFGRFGGATKNSSLLVAKLRSRAASENVEYLELMTGVNTSSKVSSLGNWNDNLSIYYDDLIKGGLKELAREASINLREIDAKSMKILDAGDPGRNVAVKYLCTVSRIKPKNEVFSQLALAFEVVNMSPLAVGINILSAEDNRTAREDYSLHMKMIDFLHGKYPNVKIALHAGELELGLVPPEDLRSHIKEAVEVGHASRIGHGVDIMRESNSQKTLSEMREGEVAVEIMPVSNKEILGVSGEDHPFPIYLTEQFVIIAHTYPQVNYSDIKNFVRNSLEYSFLRGEGIWAFPGSYSQIREECARCCPGTGCEECKAFLDKNEKAKAQWRLEQELALFESGIA